MFLLYFYPCFVPPGHLRRVGTVYVLNTRWIQVNIMIFKCVLEMFNVPIHVGEIGIYQM